MAKVFISYSWDSPYHEQKVLEFTNHLRKKGFEAIIDKMLSQDETATNFVKMMHKAMHDHPKVIVVLSKGYKTKAESFTGGVGEEYEILINDIKGNPRKYILASFEGRGDEIIPLGLKGRDVVDLSKSDGEEQLFAKLLDHQKYVFAEVASEKPKLTSVEINNFQIAEPASPIAIEAPLVSLGDTQSIGGLYKSVEFTLILNFKNVSIKTLDGFAYSLKIKQQLAPEYYGQPAQEGYFTFSETFSQKVYPQQSVKSKGFNIKVANHNIYQILGSLVTVTVYTDQGTQLKEFPVEELIKIPPPHERHKEPSPINKDLFI